MRIELGTFMICRATVRTLASDGKDAKMVTVAHFKRRFKR